MRDRLCQVLLQRLQPKRAAPRRTRRKQLMKDGDESAAMTRTQRSQDRQQPKWNTALLESIVHVMQKNVVVVARRIVEQSIERHDLKAVRTWRCPKRCEDSFASESLPKLARVNERIVANAVETDWEFRTHLEKPVH